MEEMRQLINRRQADGPMTPLNRPRVLMGENLLSKTPETVNPTVLIRLEESLAEADQSLVRAVSHQGTLQSNFEQFILEIKEVSLKSLSECCGLIFLSEGCGS